MDNLKNSKNRNRINPVLCGVNMKYIAYCILHKCWFTKETIKPKCQHLDKKHIKHKYKYPNSKCQHLVFIEKEVKEDNDV